MDFTVWTLVTDLGLMCALLLVSQVLRAKVRILQRLFLPASIIAGLLGLLFGPNALDVIPFSDSMASYPGVLIVLIMAAVPLGYRIQFRRVANRVGALYSYSSAGEALQWGLGLLLGLAVLVPIWHVNDGFGLMLGVGWAGGFGTAAAVGTTYADLGWAEAASLGYTSATIGVFVCIVGGLIVTKLASRTGRTGTLARFDELPDEARTGLVGEGKRDPIGQATLSSSSLDSLTLHLGLILLATLGAYYAGEVQKDIFPDFTIPLLAFGFLAGLLLQVLIGVTRVATYVDRDTINSLSGSFSDLLVAFGIASIVPKVVADYAVPLTLLMVFGLVFAVAMLWYLTPRMFTDEWFSRGIFTWGWMTGSVATGIALLRIVDPKRRSGTLEDFGLAFIFIVPLEIILISFSPAIVHNGYGWVLVAATVAFGLVTLLVARRVGWWAARSAPPDAEAPADEEPERPRVSS
jgi:glutamate:Na+ symporter, ESS family